MRRAWPLAVTGLLAVLAAGFCGARSYGFLEPEPSPIPIQRSEVVEITSRPAPGGPPLDFSTTPRRSALGRHLVWPISSVEPAIPVPLPGPEYQGPCPTGGWLLTITLAGGHDVAYGPCRHPPTIEALKARMVQVVQSDRPTI